MIDPVTLVRVIHHLIPAVLLIYGLRLAYLNGRALLRGDAPTRWLGGVVLAFAIFLLPVDDGYLYMALGFVIDPGSIPALFFGRRAGAASEESSPD